MKRGDAVERRSANRRGIQTYFLLLLLFSERDSLRCPSSEGGVAELFSFFGRATGMIVCRERILDMRECGVLEGWSGVWRSSF